MGYDALRLRLTIVLFNPLIPMVCTTNVQFMILPASITKLLHLSTAVYSLQLQEPFLYPGGLERIPGGKCWIFVLALPLAPLGTQSRG
jgi:hypothetical protein